MTVELLANAVGSSKPLIFDFPCLEYQELFIRDDSPESLVSGNCSAEEIPIFMDPFIKHTKTLPENLVLKLLENHQSHIDMDDAGKAKANSCIMSVSHILPIIRNHQMLALMDH